MKRGLRLLAVLAGVLALSCSWFDKYNDIEYPASFSMAGETPGDPITFSFNLYYYDKVPDTNGINFDWELRDDTFWILLQTKEEYLADTGRWGHYHGFNVGVLDTGTYTLLFEGDGGIRDTFGFVVEDSLYRLVHRQKPSVYDSISGKVVYFSDGLHDTLRRIFPDMLLVEAAPWSYEQIYLFDTLKVAILETGATELDVTPGNYSIFTVNEFHYVSGTASAEWYDAISNGLMGPTVAEVFTYDGDTLKLDEIFETYSYDVFPGLNICMGNGFSRYFFAFGD